MEILNYDQVRLFRGGVNDHMDWGRSGLVACLRLRILLLVHLAAASHQEVADWDELIGFPDSNFWRMLLDGYFLKNARQD